MPVECAIDTSVLQKANAPIKQRPRANSQFFRRIQLLQDIQQGRKIALISWRLLKEYKEKVDPPRNDFVRAFFELLGNPARCVENYARWPGRDRERARKCRYPLEDDHVLRTAVGRPEPSTIITEEQRMLASNACIYRHFKVHIDSI